MHKINIIGLGAICAAGADTTKILESFKAGRCAPQRPTAFFSQLPYLSFEVKDFFHDEDTMRTVALCFKATEEALAAAGLNDIPKGLRVGVCLGTTVACQLNDIEFYKHYRATKNIDPLRLMRYTQGNLAQAVAKRFNLTGPVLTVANACSSGTDAIGIARAWLLSDLCDLAICGGADELSHVAYCGFGALSVSSNEPCRPFDRDRKGLNLGEGAGVVILEKSTVTRQRAAKSDLYLSAYASAADAYHLTAPHPQGRGLAQAITEGLQQAQIGPKAISFINAHGTATADNDKTEGIVFKNIFGDSLKFLSTKGFTGHTLGAAGGLEAVFSCLGLRHGWVPKNIGFENEDPQIALSPLRETTKIDGSYAISTSLAFGGNNSALIFGRN